MLAVNVEDETVDLPQMLADRSPRLALDRDDVDFSHSHTSNCFDYEQLKHEEIAFVHVEDYEPC